jgi:hypothetical protein
MRVESFYYKDILALILKLSAKISCLILPQAQYQYATDLVRKIGPDTQVITLSYTH